MCRQQGGILVAGPGKDNISYIRKVISSSNTDCEPSLNFANLVFRYLFKHIVIFNSFVCGFQDKEAGDDPPVEEILKACCA